MLDKVKIARRFPMHPYIGKSYIDKKNQMIELYRDFANYIDENVTDGRLKSLTLTKLEESAMYVAKAIDDESYSEKAKERKKVEPNVE